MSPPLSCGETCTIKTRDHFVYAPIQWETVLHCNVVSHWLGAYTKWSLQMRHWKNKGIGLSFWKWRIMNSRNCPTNTKPRLSMPLYFHSFISIYKHLIPKVNTTSCGLHSFKYQIAKLWNEMPSHIKEATSLYNLKSLLSKWTGPECNCGSCVLCKVYDV